MRVEELRLRDGAHSCLTLKNSNQGSIGHLISGQCYNSTYTFSRHVHQGNSKTSWKDYISSWRGNTLGVPQEKLKSTAGGKEVWNTLISLLPLYSHPG